MLVTTRGFPGAVTLIVMTAIAIVMTAIANAQLSSHWLACTGDPGIDWDQQIKSCTWLIQSGAESKENVAIAYYNRALAYEYKEEYGRAIADYSEAIKIDPNDADSLFYRSLDKGRMGDKTGAEADMATAQHVNPNIGK